MITLAETVDGGIEFIFADACRGVLPFADILEIPGIAALASIELPNAYEVVLRLHSGDAIEIPWDFARTYCDPDYRGRVEGVAARGCLAFGGRIRALREAAGLTQQQLANAAGLGRVTLVRIEGGDQSPRYETLLALASALGCEPAQLILSADP